MNITMVSKKKWWKKLLAIPILIIAMVPMLLAQGSTSADHEPCWGNYDIYNWYYDYSHCNGLMFGTQFTTMPNLGNYNNRMSSYQITWDAAFCWAAFYYNTNYGGAPLYVWAGVDDPPRENGHLSYYGYDNDIESLKVCHRYYPNCL